MNAGVAQQLQDLIEPLVLDLGFELVAVELKTEQVGLVLRIIIYQETGVSLGDCTSVSREVSHLLEVEDPVAGAYRLEVSSPGLDRPLSTDRDFARNIGNRVNVIFEDEDQVRSVTGIIAEVDAAAVDLEIGSGSEKILLVTIKKAQLVIEF